MTNDTKLYKQRIEEVRVLLEKIQSYGFKQYVPRIKAVVQKEFKGRNFAKIDAVIARVKRAHVYAEGYDAVVRFLQSHKELNRYKADLKEIREFLISEKYDVYENAIKSILDKHTKTLSSLQPSEFKKLLEPDDFKSIKNIWDKMEENKKEINQNVIVLFALTICAWIGFFHVYEHKSPVYEDAKEKYGMLYGKLLKLIY